jgi:predicted HAD superfamily Cof-like phosphohydrolase
MSSYNDIDNSPDGRNKIIEKLNGRKSWIELVEEFLIARGDPPNASMNQEMLDSVKVLRFRLMIEELAELTIAMHESDRIGCLDAVCDSLYVVIGSALAMGFGPVLDSAFREVHRSNMTKDFEPCGPERKSGKKGAKYEEPNLEAVITNYMAGRPGEK